MMNIKYLTSRYLDSGSFARKVSDEEYLKKLFRDCLGIELSGEAALLRRIMLKVGFPRSRLRHDILTTPLFRGELRNLPFWLYYDMFVRVWLHPYQQEFLEKVKSLGIKDKIILEVGCSYGDLCRALAREPIQKIIGIDMGLTQDFYFDQLDKPISGDGFHQCETRGKRYKLRQIDVRETPFNNETFDIVISDATFEHIEDLPRAMKEMRRILKPHGLLFARWGPIWSAVDGHHFFHWFKSLRVYGDRDYNILEIPPWGHLRMSEQEIYDFIVKRKGEEVASFACQRIFHAHFLNRCMPQDYLSIIRKSGFSVRKLERLLGSDPSPEIVNEINRYSKEDLQTSGFEILLEKL